MTPLIIVPARMMSEGRPCKNREAWPALLDCVTALPSGWRVMLVTDDPVLTEQAEWAPRWQTMGPHSTVARVVQGIAQSYHRDWLNLDPIIILQPSSPTRNRPSYVLSAVRHLEQHPDHSAVVSVVPWTGEPPSKACTLGADGILEIPRTPEARQAQPRHYRRDGTVYAVRAQYARQGDLYGPTPIPLLIDPADSVTLD